MRNLIPFLILLLTSWNSFSQSSPQFVYQPSSGQSTGAAPFTYYGGRKIQSMYKPSEFPGLGAGTITAVYLRSPGRQIIPDRFQKYDCENGTYTRE